MLSIRDGSEDDPLPAWELAGETLKAPLVQNLATIITAPRKVSTGDYCPDFTYHDATFQLSVSMSQLFGKKSLESCNNRCDINFSPYYTYSSSIRS